MILGDRHIRELCEGDRPMISPFVPVQEGKPSYGLGSMGYDIRLGCQFKIPVDVPTMELSPLKDVSKEYDHVEVKHHFVIRPGEVILAESVERFQMPDDVVGVCYGKSTYARLGILVNVTPLEPGWRGILTIEIANLNKAHNVLLIPGYGICQIQFHRGERPLRTYGEKEAGGVYQDQTGVWLPR